MITVTGTQTLNGLLILEVDADPSTDGGVDAPIGSFGSASDGSGLFVKYSTSATGWSRTILSVDSLNNNVLFVEKNPTEGQFSSIEDALASITTNSPTNRFLIKVGVGIFDENQLNMKPYVSVIGSSIQETIIQPIGSHDLFVFTDVFSELSFMSLQNVLSGFSAVFCNDSGDYTQLHKVNFVDCDTNVKLIATTQDTVMYMEYCDVNGTMTYGTYQDGSSGFRAVINTENWYTFPSATGFTASYITGADAQLIINSAGIYGTATIGAPAVAGNFGIVCQNGADVVIDGAEIGGFQTALQNNNTGAGCDIHITSGSFDNNTMDINIQHPATTGGFIGDATLSKIFIDLSSTFTPLFTEQTGGGGLVVIGNISTGQKVSEVVEITTFIGAQGVGLILGGNLSDGGTFDVDVLAGVGYLNDGTLKKITWSNDSITLTADTTNYIYYNNAGVLSSANSLPDTIANLLLGKVRTNSTGIEFIDEIPLTALWADNKSDDYQRGVFGSLFQSGCITSENATPFKLDVTNGVYYYGTKQFIPSGGSFITFDRYYQDSVSTYAIQSAQTLVPNTQINVGYALVAMTASYYAKHLLLVVGDGANEKYFLVYAQSEYATLLGAESGDLPTVPTYFSEGVVRVASIIVQQGAGNIIEILSERPLPTTQTSASAPVSSHLALTDLTTGNAGHSQFAMLDGSTAMLGNFNMNFYNIINAGTVNGVTVETHASRHLPNGADPLTTASPTSNLGGSSTNSTGIQNSLSRSDHSHAIDQADTSTTGLLKSVDWNTFNNKVGGSGTTNKLSKFTGAGTIGNSIFSDDGTDATSTGVLYFSNNKGIDVTATGGTDVLNIGTSNADTINIGWSGANVNIMGNVFYQNVTELQVKDKLFTLNKGGSAGSGSSSGFEIEEGGVITGYFATNGTRDGWDFKAPAISGVATLSLASLTSSRTYTLPNNTGTLALLSDITTSQITGILSIAKGGTNSGTALNNNRFIISSGGAIVEHSAQTSGFVSFYDTNGLPSGDSAFRWNSTTHRLGIGGAASADKLTITATGTERGFIATSAVIGGYISTISSTDYSLGLENASTVVTPLTALSIIKSGHTETVGSGQYIGFDNKITGGASVTVGQFGSLITDITAGTYKSAFVWNTPNQTTGTLVERMRLTSNGVGTITSPVTTGYIGVTQLANTANSNTITNTTTETTFTGTGIAFPIPASSLSVGDRVEGIFYGIYSKTGASTLQIRLKNNAVTMLDGGARTTTTGANVGFTFTVMFTVLSIGAGGTVRANMMCLFREGTFVDGVIIPSNGTKAIDTTILQTMSFSAQWSVANAGNSITIENASWKITKAV